MKTILALLVLLASTPSWAFTTTEEFQADFSQARECKPIDGRKVWAGKDAYYIQAWLFKTGQSGQLDDEVAEAVPIVNNDQSVLSDFAAACK